MSQPKLTERELSLLLDGMCTATLLPDEIATLARALREDATAREIYCEYMSLDAELYWQLSGGESRPQGDGSATPPQLGYFLQLLGEIPRQGDLASPDNFVAFTDLEFQLLDAENSSRNERFQSIRRARSLPISPFLESSGWMDVVPWRLVGTCVFGLGLIAAMLLDLMPRVNVEQAQKPAASQLAEQYSLPSASAAATLVSSMDCRWKNRPVPLQEGASIYPDRLELVSGTAELMFGDGARVVLEGPAVFVVQDAGRAILQYGKLAAQVPKRAIGFTIGTPTVEVVDFGTEFGVAVSSQGIVDVAVLVGKVEVHSIQAPFDSRPRAEHEKRIVTAGQAVTAHRTADQLMISVANFDNTMATSLAKPFESMARMPGKVVAYRVPDRTVGNRRDFHGGVGLDFVVEAPIRVYSLGVFDHLGDGIDPSTSPVVQLWSRDVRGTPEDTSDDLGSQVLASQFFTASDSSELKLGHCFKPLPQPIELSPGSYSLVAYDLADENPFVSDSAGLVVASDAAGDGKAGGTFARNDSESYYGDLNLSQNYTLNDPFSASGSFAISDVSTFHGKFFIGHFSQSTDDDRREFVGLEFEKGDAVGWLMIRARIYTPDGTAVTGVWSGSVNVMGSAPFHFDYNYDPNYEADESHGGPEGRLTVHFYNDADTVNSTLYAVLNGFLRDKGSFDSFGIGIATMEAMEGNDPSCTAKLFIDDVTYSGHKGLVDFNIDPGWQGLGNDRDANDYGWVHPSNGDEALVAEVFGQDKLKQTLVRHIGSRSGDGKPGVFPITTITKTLSYAAGSFEYVPQQQQVTR